MPYVESIEGLIQLNFLYLASDVFVTKMILSKELNARIFMTESKRRKRN